MNVPGSGMMYGLAGLALIITAWIPETVKNIRERRIASRMEFLALYVTGSILLTVHAILIGDLVFTILNSLAATLSVTNIVLSFVYRKSRKGGSEPTR